MSVSAYHIINKYIALTDKVVYIIDAKDTDDGFYHLRLKYRICTGEDKGKIISADKVTMTWWGIDFRRYIYEDLTLAVLGMEVNMGMVIETRW